jgi:hypothetical protein
LAFAVKLVNDGLYQWLVDVRRIVYRNLFGMIAADHAYRRRLKHGELNSAG